MSTLGSVASRVIRLAACVSAIVGLLAPPLRAEGGPTVYRACGVRAKAPPTTEQLQCIAEAIGAPRDPAARLVRHGFDETYAEPTFEVLYWATRRAPGGSVMMLTRKLELSAIDGQLLFYGSAFETLPLSLAGSGGPFAEEAFQGPEADPSLAGLCPAGERPLTTERLQCIARVLGVGQGKNGWRVGKDAAGTGGEPTWTLENTIDEDPCQYYGERLEVAVVDARILGYGLTQAHCAHGPASTRPIMRTMREP